MSRRAAVLLRSAKPFSPLVPRIHYWEVPVIMKRISRWQRRTSVPPVVPFAPLATSPTAAVAAALEPIPLQPQPPLPVAPAAPVVPVAVVDSWDARLRAARKAALPLQLKLAPPPWARDDWPFCAALLCQVVAVGHFWLHSSFGALQFVAATAFFTSFRMYRYGTSLTLANPSAPKEEWRFEMKRVRFLPFLSAPRVAFTLADVDWALHDPKALYVRFALRSPPASPPLGSLGKVFGLHICVLFFESPEFAAEVKGMLAARRALVHGFDHAAALEDEEVVRKQLSASETAWAFGGIFLCSILGVLFIFVRMADPRLVKERGYFGAFRTIIGW